MLHIYYQIAYTTYSSAYSLGHYVRERQGEEILLVQDVAAVHLALEVEAVPLGAEVLPVRKLVERSATRGARLAVPGSSIASGGSSGSGSCSAYISASSSETKNTTTYICSTRLREQQQNGQEEVDEKEEIMVNWTEPDLKK